MIQRKYFAVNRRLWRLILVTLGLLSAVNPAMGMGGKPSATVEGTEKNDPLVKQAIEDLAQRKSVTPSAIELLSFELVSWPDSSMGCPLPGMNYKQVPQDGARIVLRLAGKAYSYHSGGFEAPFLCVAPKW